MQPQNKWFNMLAKARYIILFLFLNSCTNSDQWYFKEGGSLLWVNDALSDQAIKNAVAQTVENSSIIVAQVSWFPGDSSFFSNAAWYYSLAKKHGKKFMIAVDWQNFDRSGELGNWSFENDQVKKTFKRDMLQLLKAYNPDFINLGVEVNYYALTNPKGFKSFAEIFRDLKKDLKLINSNLKIGLSYQLELLYGHHRDWNATKTLATLDNLLGDIDYLGISTYPNLISINEKSNFILSLSYLDSLSSSYSIPIGISETGVSSLLFNDAECDNYISNVFKKANKLNLKFLIWGSMIDSRSDSLWYNNLGLMNKDGGPKKQFNLWKKENNTFCN